MAGGRKKMSAEEKERAVALRERVVAARREEGPDKRAVASSEELREELDNVTAIMQQLEEMRRETVIEARRKDIQYIRKMDQVIDTVLTTLTDNHKEFADAIIDLLKKRDMRGLKDLMIGFGITIDKRESLLGFDETRQMRKRKLNLKVVFKGPDGTQAGVSVEQEA